MDRIKRPEQKAANDHKASLKNNYPTTKKNFQNAIVNPDNLNFNDILSLHDVIGNQKVGQFLKDKHQKLTIQRLTGYNSHLIQLMKAEEVKAAFSSLNLYDSSEKEPSPEVVKIIVDLTEKYIDEAAIDKFDRRHKIKLTFESFIEQLGLSILSCTLEDSSIDFYTNTGYWAEKILGLIIKLEQPKGPSIADIAKSIDENEKEETVPASKRPLIECTMGQGVAANLKKFVLYSDQFSTCSAVVMFNEETSMGAIFHYAAGDKNQLVQLEQMLGHIKPSYIGIENRYTYPEDYKILNPFFTDKGYKPEIIKSSNHYYVYLDEEDTLKIDFDANHGIWINVTGMKELPHELSKSMNFYFCEKAYSDFFAKK